jgi:molecular chaperone HtpG
MTATETHEFQTETKRLLELMIHSLYSNRDIFLRELISNASDALDKRRFAGLTRPELAASSPLEIHLELDRAGRKLTIVDNGIGMSRDEVVANIGTIARSGTRELAEALARDPNAAEKPELIGQFGVGFYSSFLAAERVVLVTRKAGEAVATRWESDGAGSYTLTDAERPEAGTSVTLELTAPSDDSDVRDYADAHAIETIVRTYSDFVAYPIRLILLDTAEGEDAEPRVLNSMKAIWTRPESDVSDDEYNQFYQHVAHEIGDPLLRVSTRMEGTFEAKALLFVPPRAPWDLFHAQPSGRGVKLYVKRVLVMDSCEELLPPYLRFVRGVVDAEDLPLNVSRELLQENRQIAAIRKHITKKVLDALVKLKGDDRDAYESMWRELGAALKEGLLFGPHRNERVLDLLLAESALEPGKLLSLADYLERMVEGQDEIYTLTAESAEVARRSPHLEAFRERKVEVLIFTDRVDELWPQPGLSYEGKTLRSIGRGEIQPPGAPKADASDSDDEAPDTGAIRELALALRAALQDDVKDVRESQRLTSSPACLVTDEGDLSPQMERLMRESGRELPRVKRILEVNPKHPVLQELARVFGEDGSDPRIGEFARLLYGQAILAEGGPVDDPVAFATALSDVMLRAAR